MEKRNNMVEGKREPPLENRTNKTGKQKMKQNLKNTSKKCKREGKNISTAPKNEH